MCVKVEAYFGKEIPFEQIITTTVYESEQLLWDKDLSKIEIISKIAINGSIFHKTTSKLPVIKIRDMCDK